MGTAAENTYDAIKFSVEAQKLKADGVMIIPPFYSTPTVEELFNHFQMISKKSIYQLWFIIILRHQI